MSARRESEPIEATALGERVLLLFDEGSFTATYKFAVLLALLDLCMEKRFAPGAEAPSVTTREVAEKVIGFYWTHTLPYDVAQLRQNSRGQAEIVKAISEYRAYNVGDPSTTVTQSRLKSPMEWARLVDKVEWKLIEMPLPRLQTIGNREDEFLYTVGWDRNVRYRDVKAYQRGEGGVLDNRILFRPGVPEGLVRLGPLLKPLVRRQWTYLVARFNRLEVSRLESFLFGENRIPLGNARDLLAGLQNGRCFFCDMKLAGAWEVDHFIPWARYSNNAIENLVLTDTRCNHDKRDYLASAEHIEGWLNRMKMGSESLGRIQEFARAARWEHWPQRSRNVAEAIYRGLPDGYSLWQSKGIFVPAKKDLIERVFGTP